MRKFIGILFFALVVTACVNETKTNSTENHLATSPLATVENFNTSQEEIATQTSTPQDNGSNVFDQFPVSSNKTYCTGEVETYTNSGWVVSASDDWQQTTGHVLNSDFGLLNHFEQLAFTSRSENNKESIAEYVSSTVQSLQSTGVDATVTNNFPVNGVQYYQISAPTNNFANWQWITVNDGVVTIFSCGAPKGVRANYYPCLTIVESIQKN